ncbi:MAG: carboxypeptidase-like regulatory domain-containing protein, partial [Candidatus Sumerlaeota bacterium]|nr:carboxypeptidase-like regulatory domain-containing protein [Candidatus Sumerlaeota bacterium]
MSAYKVCKGNALCRGTAGMKPVLMAAILAVAVGAVVFYAMRKNGLDTASPLGAGDAPHATTGTASGVELANSGAAGKPVSQTPQPKKTDADAKKADAKPTSNVILIGDRKQLKVRVIWKDTEQGVPGTSISVVQCQGNPDEIGGTAMTGMTGEAVVSFPMAWTGVHVQLHNPLIASQSPHVNCPPETEHVFKVERAAMIFGKVLYEDKRVAPEAKVRALQNSSLTATADAQGAYEIGGVPAGSYQLAASLGGFISDAGGSGRGGPFIDVKAGERKGPYDIILRPGLALSGVIRDLETAKPIADAEIGRLDRNQAQVDKDSIVKSAADGSWQLAGLPIGRVTIQASAKGYATDRTMVQMIGGAKNACELALEPGATVRVKVMDEASSPIAEARVYPNRDFGGARDTAKEIKTDALGMATLEGISALKPPNIQASKDNYYMNGAGALPVFPAGIRATDVTVTLRAVKKSSKDDETSKTEKFIVFKGRVTNSEGAGIPGAEVYWGYRYNIESDKPATSGDDGTYRLEIKRQSSDQG